MTLLLIGLVLFLGLHSTRIVADDFRTRTIARIGEGPWKGLYSVLSILGFILIVYGYGQARMQMPVWNPPGWTKHLTAFLMLPVFILFVAAYIPKNALKARRRHPQVLSVKLWAFAHLLSNGNLADILLFGSFLAWSVVDFRSAKARDRAANAQPTEVSNGATVLTAVVGLAIYFVFAFWAHEKLIGVRPY